MGNGPEVPGPGRAARLPRLVRPLPRRRLPGQARQADPAVLPGEGPAGPRLRPVRGPRPGLAAGGAGRRADGVRHLLRPRRRPLPRADRPHGLPRPPRRPLGVPARQQRRRCEPAVVDDARRLRAALAGRRRRLGGRLPGAPAAAAGVYRTYDAATDTWGEPQMPPWEQPEREPRVEAAAPTNYGVDTAKLNGHREESYRLNGAPASREQIQQALGDARLPDDASR